MAPAATLNTTQTRKTSSVIPPSTLSSRCALPLRHGRHATAPLFASLLLLMLPMLLSAAPVVATAAGGARGASNMTMVNLNTTAVPLDLAGEYCGNKIPQCLFVLARALNVNNTLPAYKTGDALAAAIRVNYTQTELVNGTTAVTTPYNMTSMFFPTVDTYSKLVVNDSYRYISGLENVQVSLELIIGGVRYTLPFLKWYSATTSSYIEFRTVVVTLNKGNVARMQWMRTSCYFSSCDCLDDLCPVKCEDPKNCNIMIHLAWAGTDKDGLNLRSAMSSEWKLKNVINV